MLVVCNTSWVLQPDAAEISAVRLAKGAGFGVLSTFWK